LICRRLVRCGLSWNNVIAVSKFFRVFRVNSWIVLLD
jgi:hypothetical protein